MLIEYISVKDSAFFEVIWFNWFSKSAFHGFQEMFGRELLYNNAGDTSLNYASQVI